VSRRFDGGPPVVVPAASITSLAGADELAEADDPGPAPGEIAPAPAEQPTTLADLGDAVAHLSDGSLVGRSPRVRMRRRKALLGRIERAKQLARGGNVKAAARVLAGMRALSDGQRRDFVRDDPATPENEQHRLFQLLGRVDLEPPLLP
jgi:hypothetical protein